MKKLSLLCLFLFAAVAALMAQGYSCPQVVNAAVTGVGENNAAISWNYDAAGGEGQSVIFSYRTVGSEEWNTQTLTGTYCFLTGLTAGTTYEVTITTQCVMNMSDPLLLTFSTGSCGEVGGGMPNSASYAPFYPLYEQGYAQMLYPASALAGSDTIWGISFHTATAPANSPSRTLSVYLANTSMTELGLGTGNYVAYENLQQVVNNRSVDFSTPGWIYIPFTTPFVHDGSSNLVVAVDNNSGQWNGFNFYCHTAAVGNSVYWYQDGTDIYPSMPAASSSGVMESVPDIRFNITCDPYACKAPVLAMGAVTDNAVQLIWMPGNMEISWVVAYKSAADLEWTMLETYDTSYLVTSLNPGTYYEFKVGSVCDYDTIFTSFSTYTACGSMVIPYVEDFASNNLNPCWSSEGATCYDGALSFSYYGVSYVVLPEMETALNQLQLSVDVSGYDDSPIVVGISSDPDSLVNFQVFDTLYPVSYDQSVTKTVIFGSYSGMGGYIALVSPMGGVRLDNIKVDYIPSCIVPTHLAVSGITEQSAQLSWTEQGTATQWLVAYGVVGGDTLEEYVSGSATPQVTLSGLNPSSNYWCKVRGLCSMGDSSEWSETVHFNTLCGTVTLPYREDFSGNWAPTCWEFYQGFPTDTALTPVNFGWTSYGAYALDGNHAKLNIYGYACNYWMVTPTVWLNETSAQLTFDMALTAWGSSDPASGMMNDDRFMVMLSANGGEWTPLATWSNASGRSFSAISNTGEEVTLDLTAYVGDTVRIAFYGESTVTGGDNDLHIDNIVISEIPSCVKPQDFVAVAESNDVTLIWSEDAANAWQVTYGVAGFNPDTATTIDVADTNSYTFTGLENGETYDFYVRTDCGEEQSDWKGPYSLTIGLYQMAATGSDTLVGCGIVLTDNGGLNGAYGENCDATVVIYPDAPGKGITFYGSSYTESSYDYLRIYEGVGTSGRLLWSDPTESVLAIIPNTNSEVGPITVVFHSDYSLCFDGFELHIGCYDLPTCSRPSNLTLSNLTAQSVDLAWVENGSAESWQVAYGVNEADTLNPTLATNDTLTITGLLSGNRYAFRVRSSCGEGQYSDWSDPIYTIVGLYQMSATGSDTLRGCGLTIVDDGGLEGIYSGNANSYLVVYPEQETQGIYFWGESNMEASYDYVRIYAGVGTSGEMLFTDFDVDSTDIDTIYCEQGPITIYYHSDPYYAMDGFVLHTGCYDLPTCLMPTDLVMDSVTTTSAVVYFNGEGSSYEVRYRTLGASAWQTQSCGNPAYIAGLLPASHYEVCVRAICGAGDSSSWSAPVSFTTECDAITITATAPYTENFETTPGATSFNTSGEMPLCWRAYTNGTNSNYMPHVVDDAIYHNTHYLSLYGANSNSYGSYKVVALPEFTNPINTLRIGFNFATSEDEGELSVGYLTGGSLYGDFQAVQTIYGSYLSNFNNAFNGIPVEVMLNEVPDNAVAIALMWHATDYVQCLIDDVTVQLLPTCVKPQNLAVTNVTASTASISWTSSASNFDVSYRKGTGSWNTTTATDNNITLTGLESAATYWVKVRARCSATDISAWSDSIMFSTGCFDGAVTQFPYLEDFEQGVNCWSQEYQSQQVDWTVEEGVADAYCYTVTGAYSGTHNAILYYHDNTSATTMLVSPVFNLDGASDMQLTFAHASPDWSGDYDEHSVYYRVAPDSEWVLLADYPNAISSWQLDTLALPNLSETYQIAFKGVTHYGHGVLIDHVTIEGNANACPAPVISSVVPTPQGAEISWTGTASAYELKVRQVGETVWTEGFAASSNSYTFTGLQPLTEYQFRLRTICSTSSNSVWVDGSFSTLETPCTVPTNLHQTVVDYNAVTLDWTNGGNEQNWVVKVFNSRIGEIFDTVSAHPATINGLAANEQYFATVQAACGNLGDGFSDWSDTISFTTTECVAVSNIICAEPTDTYVQISWTSNGSENAWIVEYGMPGFGQGEEMGRVTATTNPYQLSLAGFDPETEYEVYVYAQCMEGLTSVPAGPASFTTRSIGISGIEGNADINIYPNPTTGSTTISVNGISGKVNVAIVDMNGREVMNSAMECDGDCEKVMNVEGLAQGAYFVRIYGEEINSIRKLIVR